MSISGNTAEVSQYTDGMTDQEREDFLLAQALSASEQDGSLSRQQSSRPQRTVDNCTVL
uniref:Uncharacterized protein n=1 Tax=Arion vulgaris TaxID=1028688 RepID=A0A0B7ALE9_9EUPU